MSSSKNRWKRHAHKHRRASESGFSGYMAQKICAECGKQCYRTRDEAKRSARVNHPGVSMHAYECLEPTGQSWWHLSSIPADKLKHLRDNER